jgi:maleate cis-trans isomerase
MNLEDIKNTVKPTLQIGSIWFDRVRLNRYYDVEFNRWEEYCKARGINIVDEVKLEIQKFRDAIKTQPKITDKVCNFRLVFGDPDFDIEKHAIWLIGEYVDY